MKRKIILLALAAFCLAGSAQAKIIRGFGADLGFIAALGELGQNLDAGFSGCLIVKGPRIFVPIELSLGASWQKKKETDNTTMMLLPIFLSAVIDLKRSASGEGVLPQVRIGFGGVFENVATSYRGRFSNFDPSLLLGVGARKRIHRRLSLALDLSYVFVYQTHLPGAEFNGHFVKLGFGLDYLF